MATSARFTGEKVDTAAPADIGEIRAALDHVAARLELLLKRQPPQRLLSKREAARLLGVGRGATLTRLIKEGALRTVVIGKREKIPMVEIERLITSGAPFSDGPRSPAVATPVQAASSPRRRPAPARSTVAAIRALPL